MPKKKRKPPPALCGSKFARVLVVVPSSSAVPLAPLPNSLVVSSEMLSLSPGGSSLSGSDGYSQVAPSLPCTGPEIAATPPIPSLVGLDFPIVVVPVLESSSAGPSSIGVSDSVVGSSGISKIPSTLVASPAFDRPVLEISSTGLSLNATSTVASASGSVSSAISQSAEASQTDLVDVTTVLENSSIDPLSKVIPSIEASSDSKPQSAPLTSGVVVVAVPCVGSSSQSPTLDEKAVKPDLPWAAKFKASLHNLKQMNPPTFLEDGTPVVVAPPSVLLKSAALWKGHVVAQFHGLCPSANRIFSDLNPIWGNFGDITVRIVSETVALIFIPAMNTRQWVVDVGFWQAGNCSCTVYAWSPDGLRDIEELKTAPTWAILKNVPPQLYSLEGISVIASGIGVPLHTEKSRLDSINIGSTKVKVVIKLDSSLPSSVVVRDVQGNSARIEVEYPLPPPKCLNCGKYGNLLSRCLIPLSKKLPFKKDSPSGTKEVAHSTIALPSAVGAAPTNGTGLPAEPEVPWSKPKRSRSRSKKRSLSSPPKIVALPVLQSPGSPSVQKLHNGRNWVAKPCAVSGDQSPPPSKCTAVESDSLQAVLLSKKSVRDSIKDPDPNFPLPLGWNIMSIKTKKKELKKWHNRIRSTVSGPQGNVCNLPSDVPSIS